MSDNSFQVYLDNVLTLAQTLIVKSEYVAQRTNDRLLQFLEYETDLENPQTWKYYMNLAGEYHPTDTLMVVTSSDNLEEIDFTRENLIRHRNTARDYKFGTRQYGELLAKYPGQEDVILGILNPVDKATAIAATDHKILGYPDGLIESNEYTLIEELQKWTDIYFKRYYNWQYTISDSLYYAVVLSMYHMNLVPAITSLRHKKHKTIEAHSFYVKQYLASNSNLGQYHQYMTLEQAMHFYRNIRYYQRHPGSNDTLDKLIDALMTKRNMPMASYSMRHDTEYQLENIYPGITFKRSDMTSIPSAGAPEYINTSTFLAKEVPEAPENDAEIAYLAPEITQFLKDSPSNVVQTKVLESAMINYAGAQTYKLEDIMIAHWLYYAHLNKYSAFVNVANPKTSERIVIGVKDAYILALYCMYMSLGVEPQEIPLLGAERVQRYPIPPDSDIKSVVDMSYVDDFSWNTAKLYVEETVEMISIDAFHERMLVIHKSANLQRNLVSYQEGMHERSEVYKMITRYWEDAYVRLEPEGTTFQEWMLSRNLNFNNLDREEFELLYANLVTGAIGKTLTTAPTLRNVQKAMASALKDLSSYTIQVVTMMADEETIMTDMPSLRVGSQEVSAQGHSYIRIGNAEIMSQKVTAKTANEMPLNIFTDVIERTVRAKASIYMDISNGPHAPDRGLKLKHYHPLGRLEINLVNPPDVSGTSLEPILGMNHFIALTPEQKSSLFEL